MAFLAAAALLAAFFANVVSGAVAETAFVGNVAEMLVLFGASIAFVVGILQREAEAKADKS